MALRIKIKTKKTEASLADDPVSATLASAVPDAAPVSAALDATLESEQNNREVIYIRYDDINMKYVYLCVHCDTTWKTDNRA